MGKLAAGVAHEINNPLNIISLDVEFLKSQVEPTNPMMENLHSISEEVERIAHIVQQLRDHAKMDEAGHEIININEIISSHIFSIAFSQLMKRGIKIELDLDKSNPLIMIPRTKITQVLMNLIKNAEDAMTERGALHVCTRQILQPKNIKDTETVSASSKTINNLVEIVISDNGQGIKPEDMNYLFEPFFTTKGFDGTGLGLFISYSIIKSYNGTIKVESEVGRGTTFSIVLPAANYQRKAPKDK